MKKPVRSKPTGTVNRAALARLMGVSLPTIDDWQRRGCPVAESGARGRSYSFNPQAVIEWRVKDERRRQGLPTAALPEDADPKYFGTEYNPFRQIAYNSVRSFIQMTFNKLMLEEMFADVQERAKCDERTAKMVVGGICIIQWQAWGEWVKQDRFNRQCDVDLDELASKGSSRVKFIRGPMPHEQIDNGEHLPDAVNDLFSEMFANHSTAAATAEDRL